MANHSSHRRILASTDPPYPSSMDPILKRHPKPTSNHVTTSNPDPTTLYKSFCMSSKPNSNDRVTSSLTNQKPSNHPLPASTDAHLQVKGMSLSADFDSCRITFIKPKHHRKLKPFDPIRAEKNSKTNEASRQKVKKLSSHEWVEEKKVEEVGVRESEKKEADAQVKMGRELQDLVESVEKEKMGKVWEKKREQVSSKAKGSKEMKGLMERPPDIKRVTVSLEGGRRRSCSDSPVELAGFLAKNGARVVSVDMPPFMQIHAVDCARKTCDSLEKFTAKTLALTLKKEFDGVYGPAWHCIVGTSFGSFVTHSVGGFMYFSMDQKLYVLLFKTTVQRAD